MLGATLHAGFSIDYLVSSKGYELTAKLQSFQVCAHRIACFGTARSTALAKKMCL
jgi:hypothetical protein